MNDREKQKNEREKRTSKKDMTEVKILLSTIAKKLEFMEAQSQGLEDLKDAAENALEGLQAELDETRYSEDSLEQDIDDVTDGMLDGDKTDISKELKLFGEMLNVWESCWDTELDGLERWAEAHYKFYSEDNEDYGKEGPARLKYAEEAKKLIMDFQKSFRDIKKKYRAQTKAA